MSCPGDFCDVLWASTGFRYDVPWPSVFHLFQDSSKKIVDKLSSAIVNVSTETPYPMCV